MNCLVKALLPVLVVLVIPMSASASHYDIPSSGIVDEAVAGRLAAQGINSTKDLWAKTLTRNDRARLAKKVKVAASEVLRWHDFCDLLRLSGVGPKVARVMTVAGVNNLKALARQNPDDLAARVAAVRDKVPELGKLPDRNNFQSWIEQAASLVKEDASPKK